MCYYTKWGKLSEFNEASVVCHTLSFVEKLNRVEQNICSDGAGKQNSDEWIQKKQQKKNRYNYVVI